MVVKPEYYVYLTVHHCDSWRIKDQLDVTCYFISLLMCSTCFRTLIYSSSGACDCAVELPLWPYCSWFDVCWNFGVVGLEWYPCCRLKHNACATACNTGTTPTQPHRISNTHRAKNNTTNVVIQQNSGKLLMMDILMSENVEHIISEIK